MLLLELYGVREWTNIGSRALKSKETKRWFDILIRRRRREMIPEWVPKGRLR
jgi:hypothetical protein